MPIDGIFSSGVYTKSERGLQSLYRLVKAGTKARGTEPKGTKASGTEPRQESLMSRLDAQGQTANHTLLVRTDQLGQAVSAQSTITSSIVLAFRSHGDAYQSSKTQQMLHSSQARGSLQSSESRSPTMGDSCEAYHILGQTLTYA
ncbi:hypothetical protein HGM15179_021245 [Zosterops borbonicus]|uniref:Uncharacterized protein n=1 Tax=Zosterops borbonicus TaxID=364589 RepID=A0A8K1D687_9PASS|nr:hypothetical protein HGM15179_021245 [Zosterops borbonicus]